VIVVYSVPLCGACDQLKAYIHLMGMTPEVEDLRAVQTDGATLTDMRLAGLHGEDDRAQAPILRVGDDFWPYRVLFDQDGRLNKEVVDKALMNSTKWTDHFSAEELEEIKGLELY